MSHGPAIHDGITLLSLSAERSDETTFSVAYLYDEDGRPYAGVYAGEGAATPVTFLIATTDRGDVVALADTSGEPFARYAYDPYGAVLSQASNAVTGISAALASSIAARQPLRYAGYVYDAHSATFYLSARHYDPATMRFLTKDPARDDGEESVYQYCAGDPVGKVDPSGMASHRWISVGFHYGKPGNWYFYRQYPPGQFVGALTSLAAYKCEIQVLQLWIQWRTVWKKQTRHKFVSDNKKPHQSRWIAQYSNWSVSHYEYKQ